MLWKENIALDNHYGIIYHVHHPCLFSHIQSHKHYHANNICHDLERIFQGIKFFYIVQIQ